MIEHRWGRRKSIALDVQILRGRRRPVRGRSRDVSSSGMFVAAPVAALAMHAQVELVMTLRDRDMTRIKRIAAMVARLGEDGVGLTFAAPSARDIRELLALCRANASRPAVPVIAQAAPRPGKPSVHTAPGGRPEPLSGVQRPLTTQLPAHEHERRRR